MKMDRKGYIWLLAFASAFGSALSDIKFADCYNSRKNKTIHSTPVFSVDEENLSFPNCGKWERKNGNEIPPWRVYLGSIYCSGVVLSSRTIMSNFIDVDENVNIFGGECMSDSKRDRSKCLLNRGLLPQKVLRRRKVEMRIGGYGKSIDLWTVEALSFTESLQPVCLWNRDDQNDTEENFHHDVFKQCGMKKLDVLPGERCKKERLEYWECEIHMTNTLCSSVVVSWPWNLFIERGGRFYLRGVIVSEPRLIDRSRWIDFLPFMRQILSATQDLVMMPDVSDLKERIDFGKGQSFPGCGKLPRRRHNRRQVDNIDPDAAGFITRGNNAVKGNHPWHGSLSIYPENNNNTNEDFCGATLISNKTLITAAHCFSVVTNFSDLEVMHDSSYVGEDSQQTFKVSKLLIHPGYQILNNALHNDIALITLESEVQITDFVRPICLWNSDYDLIKIANKTSVVCGWGLTSNHTQPVTLQEANVQVISYEDCYMSNKTFFSKYMLPRQNFCAGFPHNQTSACKGDSGGGLYLRERSKNFLRGVVSSGSINKVLVGKNKITTCDPNYYALFTDVANYMQWIVQNAPDINLPATP